MTTYRDTAIQAYANNQGQQKLTGAETRAAGTGMAYLDAVTRHPSGSPEQTQAILGFGQLLDGENNHKPLATQAFADRLLAIMQSGNKVDNFVVLQASSLRLKLHEINPEIRLDPAPARRNPAAGNISLPTSTP